jgi:acetate kinase
MFWEAGVRRYGFHGLSCESVLHALGTDVPQRVIVVHLGSGASITAIANGSSVDTTMGLTPTGGIVMSTRPGDLDPGALLYLLRMLGGNAAKLEALLDKESGLLGVSGLSGDMRQLHQAADNPRAQCAIEIFCRSAAKAVGAFVTILGGLDLLIFTGGIGEHDAKVREKICAALEPLGVTVDPQSNQSNLRRISAINSRVPAFVLPSDENTQIARHVYRLLLSRAVGGEGA